MAMSTPPKQAKKPLNHAKKPAAAKTGQPREPGWIPVAEHGLAVTPQDLYYDYIGPSGAKAHVSEVLPRAALRYVQRIAARARLNGVEIAAQYRMHVTDLYVLMVLQRSPEHSATATNLKDVLSYTSGGMTKRIDRLEQQGLVERCSHPTDRRAWIIKLTDNGLAVAKKISQQGVTSGILKKISSVFDEHEWERFAEYLQRLDGVLEAAGIGAVDDITD
jgi:DNA-binding MarR family transcriptional regulator